MTAEEAAELHMDYRTLVRSFLALEKRVAVLEGENTSLRQRNDTLRAAMQQVDALSHQMCDAIVAATAERPEEEV